MKSMMSCIGVPGRKMPLTPDVLQFRNIDVGDDAADDHQHVVQPFSSSSCMILRADVHVRAGQDRQADHVRILLERRGDDLLGRLAQPGVDHFHPGVTQRARDHLRATIVAVQTGLGDDDANVAHQGLSSQLSALSYQLSALSS